MVTEGIHSKSGRFDRSSPAIRCCETFPSRHLLPFRGRSTPVPSLHGKPAADPVRHLQNLLSAAAGAECLPLFFPGIFTGYLSEESFRGGHGAPFPGSDGATSLQRMCGQIHADHSAFLPGLREDVQEQSHRQPYLRSLHQIKGAFHPDPRSRDLRRHSFRGHPSLQIQTQDPLCNAAGPAALYGVSTPLDAGRYRPGGSGSASYPAVPAAGL